MESIILSDSEEETTSEVEFIGERLAPSKKVDKNVKSIDNNNIEINGLNTKEITVQRKRIAPIRVKSPVIEIIDVDDDDEDEDNKSGDNSSVQLIDSSDDESGDVEIVGWHNIDDKEGGEKVKDEAEVEKAEKNQNQEDEEKTQKVACRKSKQQDKKQATVNGYGSSDDKQEDEEPEKPQIGRSSLRARTVPEKTTSKRSSKSNSMNVNERLLRERKVTKSPKSVPGKPKPKSPRRSMSEENERGRRSSSATQEEEEETETEENVGDDDDGSDKVNSTVTNLLDKLIEVCGKADLGETMGVIEKKLNKYLPKASRATTESPMFQQLLRRTIQEIGKIVKNTTLTKADKCAVAEKVKIIFQELKSNGVVVTEKLNVLYRLFYRLQKQIEKLETTEVESDDEHENIYVLLHRYRKKATEVYAKICQLEEKAAHANRQYLQRFTYCGKGPIQIQRALEKYYNQTRKFPNYRDVLQLARKVNQENNLGLSETEVAENARIMFTDFGKKLQQRRQYDDYHIMNGYITEGQKDPALYDPELKYKLDKNISLWATREQEVLADFARKAAKMNERVEEEESEDHKSEKSDEEEEESNFTDNESVLNGDKNKVEENALLSDSDEEFNRLEAEEGNKRKKSEADEEDDHEPSSKKAVIYLC